LSNEEIKAEADRAEIIRLLREQNEMFQRIEQAVIEVVTDLAVMASKIANKQ
jgi:hypothetical protein